MHNIFETVFHFSGQMNLGITFVPHFSLEALTENAPTSPHPSQKQKRKEQTNFKNEKIKTRKRREDTNERTNKRVFLKKEKEKKTRKENENEICSEQTNQKRRFVLTAHTCTLPFPCLLQLIGWSISII